MATQYESARLILELYNLRREATMREARNFWIGFNPQTVDDMLAALAGPNGGHVRMVISYWDMACSLVLNGAIDQKMAGDAEEQRLGGFRDFPAGGFEHPHVDFLAQVFHVGSTSTCLAQELHECRLQRQYLANKPSLHFGRACALARSTQGRFSAIDVRRVAHPP